MNCAVKPSGENWSKLTDHQKGLAPLMGCNKLLLVSKQSRTNRKLET